MMDRPLGRAGVQARRWLGCCCCRRRARDGGQRDGRLGVHGEAAVAPVLHQLAERAKPGDGLGARPPSALGIPGDHQTSITMVRGLRARDTGMEEGARVGIFLSKKLLREGRGGGRWPVAMCLK